MIRAMRRKRQELTYSEAEEILKRGKTGVLAVMGDDDYPYAVPLHYFYCDGKIYIHGAKAGHKFDAIKNNPKVSFCVIDKDEVVPEKASNNFRSAIAFGKARIIENEEEIIETARKIGLKYTTTDVVEKEIKNLFRALATFEITVEHLTAKEGIGLVKMRG